MRFMKRFMNDFASRFGFNIMKYPISRFRSVPVFDLSVQLLMASKGPKLEFIQIGANDGSFGDPLRKYILAFPWRGIVVEPQPDVFAKLCLNYDAVKDRLIFENIAIANHAGTIAMYRGKRDGVGNTGYTNRESSMNPEIVARQLRVQPSQLETLSVPCLTLDALVKKHRISHLDVLQIDTEGQDFNVLKTLDLSSVAPLIVQIEHGHLSPKDLDLLVQHLSKNGYRVLYGGRQHDTIALHDSFPLT